MNVEARAVRWQTQHFITILRATLVTPFGMSRPYSGPSAGEWEKRVLWPLILAPLWTLMWPFNGYDTTAQRVILKTPRVWGTSRKFWIKKSSSTYHISPPVLSSPSFTSSAAPYISRTSAFYQAHLEVCTDMYYLLLHTRQAFYPENTHTYISQVINMR